jgi:hypothetical protein
VVISIVVIAALLLSLLGPVVLLIGKDLNMV